MSYVENMTTRVEIFDQFGQKKAELPSLSNSTTTAEARDASGPQR